MMASILEVVRTLAGELFVCGLGMLAVGSTLLVHGKGEEVAE